VGAERFDLGRFGIWTTVLDRVTSAEAKQTAVALEQMGFSTLWLPETVGRDPFITATLLLGATTTLRVATGIANIYGRDAVTMANTQRAIEEAFPGRFLLGLGVSHEHLVSKVRHHDYSRPYSRMVSYLDEMDGAVFRAVGPQERPATVLAALGPRMLALAGRRGDGAHPYFVPVEHTHRARDILGPGAILAPEQMIVLDRDTERARQVARAGMAVYLRAPNYLNNLRRFGFDDDDFADGGSDRLVDAIVAIGDLDTIVTRMAAHLDAGASHVCVQVLQDDLSTPPLGAWNELAGGLASLSPNQPSTLSPNQPSTP
jgi:probable F420-dependent oxidoreductase